MEQNTCKVYQFVTCITLYLSFIVGIYEYTTLVLYSDSVLYCTFMLSVYAWGQFRPTYIRRSDVPVSAGSGRYNCVDNFEFSYMVGMRISRLMLAEIIISVLDIISDQ